MLPAPAPFPSATDEELVSAVRTGDRDAFESLYDRYHAGIYNLCARIVSDREEAKDLTQDTFATAFSRLPSSEGELALRPWLYRVATNACFNHLRARKHLDGGDGSALEMVASGVDEFERAHTVACVEQSLTQLNDRYRTALVLKDLQGLPVEEIATVLETSRANADLLVHRARASFKRAFTKLAGEGAATPASLALVLGPLAIPAALRHMPAALAHAAASGGAVSMAHGAAGAAHAGAAAHAAGSGLFSKIAATLTSKVVLTAAAATVVVGGTVAAIKVETAKPHRPPIATTASVRSGSAVTVRHLTAHGWQNGWSRWAGHGWMGYSSTWCRSGGATWSSGSGWSPSGWSGSSGSKSSGSHSSWSSGSSGKWSNGSSGSKSSGSWSGGSSGSKSSGSWSSGSSGSKSSGSWSGGSSGSSGSGW